MVGAGPAGADLAAQLARAGTQVVLIDRLPDLRRAAFSSAALPLEAVARFGLPAAVVASRWSGWELLGPGERQRRWSSASPQGVVLDFGALRHWLAQEARGWGATLLLGHQALRCQAQGDTMVTSVRTADGRSRELRTAWVVDASGQERRLLGDPPPDPRDRLVSGVGLEWLVELPEAGWRRWSDQLAFCLGSDWIAQGYGWVFPMQAPLLKVGVCRLEDHSRAQPALRTEMGRLLARLFDPATLAALRVRDRHGGLIRSTIRRREPHRRGRLIGLGDAVSTANLLGGEGIRHALCSSRVLAPLLLEAARMDDPAPLAAYPARLRRALGWRWSLSGRLARRTWLGLRDRRADARLDRLLASLEDCRGEDLSALLFRYRFERYGLKSLPYLLGWR